MGNISLRGLQMLQFKKTYTEAQYFFSDIRIKPFGEGYPTPRETEAMQYNSKINRPGIYYDRLEMLAWVYTTDKKLFLIPERKFKDLLEKVGHIPLSAEQAANMEFVREFLTPEEEERYSYDRDWKINKKTALRLKRIQLLLDKSPEKGKKIEIDVQKYEEAFVYKHKTAKGLQVLQCNIDSIGVEDVYDTLVIDIEKLSGDNKDKVKLESYQKIKRPGMYYHRRIKVAWIETTDNKVYLLKPWKFKELLKESSHKPLAHREVVAFETLWDMLTPEQRELFYYDKQLKESKKTMYRFLGREDTILKDKPYETTFCTCPICIALKEKMATNPITIPYAFDANPDREKDIAMSFVDTGWKIAALSEVVLEELNKKSDVTRELLELKLRKDRNGSPVASIDAWSIRGEATET